MDEPLLPPLPSPFQEVLQGVVPADRLAAVLASFATRKPTAFRLNPLRGDLADTRQELAAAGFTLEAIDWLPAAFCVADSQRRALTESAPCREGRIYIQSLSSMVAPLALAPQPGETILDLAAAPGGKTLLLAALMGNQGRISAVESVRGRFFKMRANLERCGAAIVRTYLMDGRAVGRKCSGMFDRVLLDAPCSSEARFSRLNPASWAHWSPRKVSEAARKQQGLLRAAVASLRPGGSLLYCTCSFSPEENELIIDAALRQYGTLLAVTPIPISIPNTVPGLTCWRERPLHRDLAQALRILPDERLDGFFLCRLEKGLQP
jgi:16S rRNA (cytosine1407-C5)-methyltransferase